MIFPINCDVAKPSEKGHYFELVVENYEIRDVVLMKRLISHLFDNPVDSSLTI